MANPEAAGRVISKLNLAATASAAFTVEGHLADFCDNIRDRRAELQDLLQSSVTLGRSCRGQVHRNHFQSVSIPDGPLSPASTLSSKWIVCICRTCRRTCGYDVNGVLSLHPSLPYPSKTIALKIPSLSHFKKQNFP